MTRALAQDRLRVIGPPVTASRADRERLMPKQRTGAPPGRRHRPLQRTLPPGWTAPPPPRTLSRAGRKWWRTIWAAGATWMDEHIDSLMIERTCATVDQVATVQAHLNEVGRWYTTKQGVIAAHPGVADIRHMDAQITSALSLLGFSPADRARLNLTMRSDDDELTKYRNRNTAHRSATVGITEPV